MTSNDAAESLPRPRKQGLAAAIRVKEDAEGERPWEEFKSEIERLGGMKYPDVGDWVGWRVLLSRAGFSASEAESHLAFLGCPGLEGAKTLEHANYSMPGLRLPFFSPMLLEGLTRYHAEKMRQAAIEEQREVLAKFVAAGSVKKSRRKRKEITLPVAQLNVAAALLQWHRDQKASSRHQPATAAQLDKPPSTFSRFLRERLQPLLWRILPEMREHEGKALYEKACSEQPETILDVLEKLLPQDDYRRSFGIIDQKKAAQFQVEKAGIGICRESEEFLDS